MDSDHRLLDLPRRSQITRHGTDHPCHVWKEKNFTDHQDGNSSVDKEKSEPVQIKEEWDELKLLQMTDSTKKQELGSVTENQTAIHHQQIKEEQVELQMLQVKEDQVEPQGVQMTMDKVEQEPMNKSQDQEELQHQQIKVEPEDVDILQVKVEETEICISQDEEKLLLKQETDSFEERDYGEPEPIRNQLISQDFPEAETHNQEGSNPEDSESSRDENLYSCE
ncbi:hypothetical protein XENORESO_005088, partial [Xenotaenia resolanae]